MATHNEIMYEILFGHKPGVPEPGEFKVFRRVSAELNLSLKKHGHSLVRQIVIESNKNGLSGYYQYVFFTIASGRKMWPVMSNENTIAMSIGGWLMMQSSTMPNYTDGLEQPPTGLEENVDTVVSDVAKWCSAILRRNLAKEYIGVIKDHVGSFYDVVGVDGQKPTIMGLKVAFEDAITRHRLAIPGSLVAHKVVRFINI